MNNEEQIKVLQMVADGVISVEEGEKLLITLEETAEAESYTSELPDVFSKDFINDMKQSRLDKKRNKEYKKHLKRTQKAEDAAKHRVSTTIHNGEDRLTRAANELAQKAVDQALESIGKELEKISCSIFD